MGGKGEGVNNYTLVVKEKHSIGNIVNNIVVTIYSVIGVLDFHDDHFVSYTNV